MKNITDFVNKIICGDCLEVMKEIPDNSVDLVVTSPPYNIGNKSLGYHPNSKTNDKFYDKYNDNIPDKEYAIFLTSSILECIRISRYVFWNMQLLSTNKKIILDIIGNFSNKIKDIFIWKKHAVSQIIKGTMAKGYEFVICFSNEEGMNFSYNNFPKNNYVPNNQQWFKKGKETIPEHHATFPKLLPEYFIKYFSHQNDIILDPFMGSGTTAVSCIDTNRKYIGIEISQNYCDIINKRIEEAKRKKGLENTKIKSFITLED